MLRRPPVIIFLVSVLVSCLVGYAIIYSTLAAHLHGDNIRLENEYLEIEFPRNWLGVTWELGNDTSGKGFNAYFAPTDVVALTLVRAYDDKATQIYMNEGNLADTFSIVIFEANRLYNWSLDTNENATMSFIENGTMFVSNCRADFTRFIIQDGLEQDNALYNLTCVFLSCIEQQRLFQVAFWGEEEDWTQTYGTFEVILDSIKI